VEELVVDRVDGTPGPAAKHVETHVRRDTGDPGAELIATVETGQGLVNAQEGLLSGLLSILLTAEHPPADPGDPSLEALMDGLVDLLLPALIGENELSLVPLGKLGALKGFGRIHVEGVASSLAAGRCATE
jgi:hypothetical protein